MAWEDMVVEHKLWVMHPFLQQPPVLPDAWSSDGTLREGLRFYLGEDLFERARTELAALGRAATSPATLALAMKAEQEPPLLIPYGPWGDRRDTIVESSAYKELGRLG